MKNMQPLDIVFPIMVVALVFMGIFTLFLLSDSSLMAGISSLDTEIGRDIRNSKFGLMDRLAPHLLSVYFWMPFYCFVILMLAGFDRVKFLRICAALVACLLVMELFIVSFNALASYSFPSWCRIPRLKTVTTGKCFLLSAGAALSFGLAVFVSRYLDAQYRVIKAALFVWALLIGYGQIYEGQYYPGALLLSMVAGTFIAIGCSATFKYLLKKRYR
jgi:undecaprenyl-diphosphatase